MKLQDTRQRVRGHRSIRLTQGMLLLFDEPKELRFNNGLLISHGNIMTDRMILRDASQESDYDCHLMFRFLYGLLAQVTVGRNPLGGNHCSWLWLDILSDGLFRRVI